MKAYQMKTRITISDVFDDDEGIFQKLVELYPSQYPIFNNIAMAMDLDFIGRYGERLVNRNFNSVYSVVGYKYFCGKEFNPVNADGSLISVLKSAFQERILMIIDFHYRTKWNRIFDLFNQEYNALNPFNITESYKEIYSGDDTINITRNNDGTKTNTDTNSTTKESTEINTNKDNQTTTDNNTNKQVTSGNPTSTSTKSIEVKRSAFDSADMQPLNNSNENLTTSDKLDETIDSTGSGSSTNIIDSTGSKTTNDSIDETISKSEKSILKETGTDTKNFNHNKSTDHTKSGNDGKIISDLIIKEMELRKQDLFDMVYLDVLKLISISYIGSI